MSNIKLNSFSITDAITALPLILKAGLVPYITGSPGIGKSDIIKQYAKSQNAVLIDIRLAQYEALDIGGIPKLTKSRTKFSHVPLNVFPVKGDKLPKGKKKWVLFFDELPLASASTRKAAYKIILDRYIGAHKLHKKVEIICAGNLATDNADAVRVNTALSSRLIHILLKAPSTKEWLQWAYVSGIDFHITSFIENSGDMLDTFDTASDSDTFACGRTWEFYSNLIKEDPSVVSSMQLAAASVGDSAAIAFNNFVSFSHLLTTIDQVESAPKQAKIPDDPSAVLMTCSSLAYKTTAKNIVSVAKYIGRMSIVYQVNFYRTLVAKHPSMHTSKTVLAWLKANKDKIL